MVHVKAPVFSFSKLNDVDSLLGPEMKSTGEVMGSDINFAKALDKAFTASGYQIPDHGSILMTIRDEQKPRAAQIAKRLTDLGFSIYATQGTATFFEEHGVPVMQRVNKLSDGDHDQITDLMVNKRVALVVNTVDDSSSGQQDGVKMRALAISHEVLLMTALDTVAAIVTMLEDRAYSLEALS